MTPELKEAIESAKALRDLIGRGLLKKPTPEELDRLQFLAALEASEGDRVDAERYRTLREMDWFDGPLCVVRNPKHALTHGAALGVDCPSRSRLDEAIDAARKPA